MRLIFVIFLGIAVTTAFFLFLMKDITAPVVYLSTSKTQKEGETICAFVDTENGRERCSSYSLASRKKMTQRWAE